MLVSYATATTESPPLYNASLTVVVSTYLSQKITLLPSYLTMIPINEMRLVLKDTVFSNSDESKENLFMDICTTYGNDLYVESLATSLVEGLDLSNTTLHQCCNVDIC